MDSGQGWIVDTTHKLEQFVDFINRSFADGKHNLYLIKDAKQICKTKQCNACMVQTVSGRTK